MDLSKKITLYFIQFLPVVFYAFFILIKSGASFPIFLLAILVVGIINAVKCDKKSYFKTFGLLTLFSVVGEILLMIYYFFCVSSDSETPIIGALFTGIIIFEILLIMGIGLLIRGTNKGNKSKMSNNTDSKEAQKKLNTEDFSLGKFFLTLICILLGFFVGIPLILMLFAAVACPDDTREIVDTMISPEGDYQIDVICNNAGATDAGRRYLVIEYPNKKGEFSVRGDQESKKSKKISETHASFYANYEVVWNTNNKFVVLIQDAPYDEKRENIILVELTGKSYTAKERDLKCIYEDSYLSDFAVNGNDVDINCKISIKNTLPEKVYFSLEAFSSDDKGKLLDTGELIAVDKSGQEAVFEIEGEESKTFEVTFRGTKGPDDTKTDRNVPETIKLHVKDFE